MLHCIDDIRCRGRRAWYLPVDWQAVRTRLILALCCGEGGPWWSPAPGPPGHNQSLTRGDDCPVSRSRARHYSASSRVWPDLSSRSWSSWSRVWYISPTDILPGILLSSVLVISALMSLYLITAIIMSSVLAIVRCWYSLCLISVQYLPTMANVCRAELHPCDALVYSHIL